MFYGARLPALHRRSGGDFDGAGLRARTGAAPISCGRSPGCAAATRATTRYEAVLTVPRLDLEKLQLSGVVLADNVEKLRQGVVPSSAEIEIAGAAGVVYSESRDLPRGAEVVRLLD